MCFKWCNKNIKKYKWEDIALIKLSVLFFTLMLAKLWPGILSLDWYVYLIIFVLLAIPPVVKMFKK
jgi:hypothetical protein